MVQVEEGARGGGGGVRGGAAGGAGAVWVMGCHLLHSCGRALFQCRCARVRHDDHLTRLAHALICILSKSKVKYVLWSSA